MFHIKLHVCRYLKMTYNLSACLTQTIKLIDGTRLGNRNCKAGKKCYLVRVLKAENRDDKAENQACVWELKNEQNWPKPITHQYSIYTYCGLIRKVFKFAIRAVVYIENAYFSM